MPFEFTKLDIPEVILIKPKMFKDQRGSFSEIYKEDEFKLNEIDLNFVQENQSSSHAGVLRGLHYQMNPKAQGKLVRVIKGSVFDVAVDIRKNSPTYKMWVAVTLTAESQHMLWIPPGFAHGVVALEDSTELLYKITDLYSPEHERSIRFDDPELDIKWPSQFTHFDLAEKDKNAPSFNDVENNFVY